VIKCQEDQGSATFCFLDPLQAAQPRTFSLWQQTDVARRGNAGRYSHASRYLGDQREERFALCSDKSLDSAIPRPSCWLCNRLSQTIVTLCFTCDFISCCFVMDCF